MGLAGGTMPVAGQGGFGGFSRYRFPVIKESDDGYGHGKGCASQDSADGVLHRRQVGAVGERQDVRHDPPGDRRSHLRGGRGRQGRRRRGGRRGPRGVRQRALANDGRPRPRRADLQAGRPDRGRGRRAGRARNARQRQADQRLAGGRHAAGDRLPAVLRRLGRQDSRQDDPDPRRLLLLHAARAGRRGRADHPVELPGADGGLEVGPGAGRRLHDRDEAGRADAAHLPADGAARAEGRHSRTA